MRRWQGPVRAFVLVCALVAPMLVAGPASARGWGEPAVLSEDYGLRPAVADTARDGTTTTVYAAQDAEHRSVVFLRRVSVDDQLSDQVEVSGPLGSAGTFDVAVDDDGTAVVVWEQYYGERSILARRVSSDGALGPVVEVSDTTEEGMLPAVAVSPAGTATLLYRDGEVVVRQLTVDGDLTDPVRLPFDTVGEPRSSRSGHVAFGMESYVTGETSVARIDEAGQLRVRAIARDLPGEDGPVSVDLDRDGNVRAVVTNFSRKRAWVRVWRLGGRLTEARRVLPRRYSAEQVLLRSDLAGRSVVLWADQYESGNGYLVLGRSWRNGRLGPVEEIGGVRGGFGVSLWCELDDDGDGWVSWLWGNSSGFDVGTHRVRSDGTFALDPRSPLGSMSAEITVGPDGLARLVSLDPYAVRTRLVVWTRRW